MLCYLQRPLRSICHICTMYIHCIVGAWHLFQCFICINELMYALTPKLDVTERMKHVVAGDPSILKAILCCCVFDVNIYNNLEGTLSEYIHLILNISNCNKVNSFSHHCPQFSNSQCTIMFFNIIRGRLLASSDVFIYKIFIGCIIFLMYITHLCPQNMVRSHYLNFCW